ncbi:MAG: metalloregulator ArsR/SmtB family transcription factor [Candidatus Sungiibacteriota bacterium]
MKHLLKMERVLKSLANRRRLAILKYIAEERASSVNNIAGEIRLSFKATSRHLRVLAHADILEHEQNRKYVIYRVADELPALAKQIIKFL